MQKETLEIFVRKATEVHGKLYDYSRFIYATSKTKGKIICQQHGIFQQIPNTHLSGGGCPKCANKIIAKALTFTKEDFLKKALFVHKNFYDYSLIEYIDYRTKIKIICNEHGIFEQTPQIHLMGSGCQECGKNKYINALKSNKEEFTQQSAILHSDKYIYSEFIYINSRTKGKIICQQHGIFEQTPNHHLQGHGCLLCGSNKKKKAFDKEKFIKKSKQVHGELYDYAGSEYTLSHNKIEILCRKHGVFEQTAFSHWQGIGCPSCSHNISKSETKWLSELNVPFKNHSIKLNNRQRRKVDGYDPITNTVYQFHGDYYHGNPKTFPFCYWNKKLKKFAYELYIKTLQNDELIKNSGYNLVTIWESDYIQSKEKQHVDT